MKLRMIYIIFLEEASLTYDASVSDILNFCIAELIRTNDLKIYTSLI